MAKLLELKKDSLLGHVLEENESYFVNLDIVKSVWIKPDAIILAYILI